jgi:hypothetical protein
MATTKHTCNDGRGPAWGRRTAGCPRCDELTAGAEPIRWAPGRAERDRQRTAEIHAHFASERHRRECQPVCTYGDW